MLEISGSEVRDTSEGTKDGVTNTSLPVKRTPREYLSPEGIAAIMDEDDEPIVTNKGQIGTEKTPQPQSPPTEQPPVTNSTTGLSPRGIARMQE